MIDLSKILRNGQAMFLAYDQGMEHGPEEFNDENVDPDYILDIAIKGKFTSVIFQKGVAEKYYSNTSFQNQIPLILKLNGKTNLIQGQDPYSPQICSVDEAIQLGASAVGYTVYVGSEFESRMFSEFSEIEKDAHSKNIPLMGWMYIAGKQTESKDKKELTAYAARLGLEMGADIIKIKYPGNLESLKWAVESAGKTKVVVSGGSKESEEQFLKQVQVVMESGAVGMAVGRNIWQDPNPVELANKVSRIIFGTNI